MKNNFFNYSVANIYTKPLSNSKVSSQILYGEKFKVLSKKKEWLKIKTNFDNYIGFIKNGKFNKNFKPSHKVFNLKSQIFKRSNYRFVPTKKFIYFASRIKLKKQNANFIEFEKDKWIRKKDIKDVNHFEKDFIKIFKLFLKTKYLWGGKSCDGIDCSALVQILSLIHI